MPKNTTCGELEDYAFSTHPYCYVDNGFCELSVHDWEAIVEIVGLETFAKSWDTLKTAAEVAGKCLEFYLWGVERALF